MAKTIDLHDGEVVLDDVLQSVWWTWPYYIFTVGLWSIWRKHHRFILTNHRLVAIKGVVGKKEQALPLVMIQNVSVNRSPITGGTINLSTAGTTGGFESIPKLTQAMAKMLSQRIQIAAKEARETRS